MKNQWRLGACVLGLLCTWPLAAKAAFVEKPDANTLWIETGSGISVGKGGWRAGGLEIRPADVGFTLEGAGKKVSSGRYVPLDGAYRYLVMDITKVQSGEGYRGLTIYLSGVKDAARGGMVSYIQTGRFILPMFAPGQATPKSGFLSIYLYNTTLTLKWLKMVKRPTDNLEILPSKGVKAVRPGDEVTFRVTLAKPAEDVTLTFYNSYTMPRLRINGQSRLQLKPEDEAEKIWSAKVKMKSLTQADGRTGVDLKPGRLMAKTTILGGSLDESLWTWNTIPFNFKAGAK